MPYIFAWKLSTDSSPRYSPGHGKFRHPPRTFPWTNQWTFPRIFLTENHPLLIIPPIWQLSIAAHGLVVDAFVSYHISDESALTRRLCFCSLQVAACLCIVVYTLYTTAVISIIMRTFLFLLTFDIAAYKCFVCYEDCTRVRWLFDYVWCSAHIAVELLLLFPRKLASLQLLWSDDEIIVLFYY